MARALRETYLTPADELRELLGESEKLVVALRGRGGAVEELLENLDRIEELWPHLESAGVDLRPEAGRWATLQASVHGNAPAVVHEMNAIGGLGAARGRVHGAEQAAWWWYLDEEVKVQRANRIKKRVAVVAAVLGIVMLAYFLFTRLFPVDPAVQASTAAMLGGQQMVQSGDLEGALVEFQAATRATPDDPEPWAWTGVIQEKLGRAAEAEQSFARARTLTKDEIIYHILRAQVYGNMGMNSEAEAEALAALAIDPERPEAHLSLANAYEGMDQMDKAIEHMRKAADYAEARGQSELTVVARYRLAIMLQRLSLPQEPSVTPTPG